MKDKVINYLLSLGFEIQPCAVPLDQKNSIKCDLYYILGSKSVRLGNLLRKYFPVKLKSERNDQSIWFILRDKLGKSLYEIEFKPDSVETRGDNFLEIVYSDFNYSKWSFRVCGGLIFGSKFRDPSFAFTDGDDFFYLYDDQEQEEVGCGCLDEIEYHFNQIPQLKQIIREFKLKKLLDGE